MTFLLINHAQTVAQNYAAMGQRTCPMPSEKRTALRS